MVILVDKTRLQAILDRLHEAGLPKRRACCFFDESCDYYEDYCDTEHDELEYYGSRENLRRLDLAAKLIRSDHPVDLVSKLTGISIKNLLYFMDENR